MNRFTFSAFFVAAVFAVNFHNAIGQTINATMQTTAPRVVASRGAPATAAKPVANARVAPKVVPRPTGLNPQRFNANLPRTNRAATSQSSAHLFANRAEFESGSCNVKRAARWTSATTHYS